MSGPRPMNSRGPYRSASRPIRLVSRNITIVEGINANPAARARSPATSWRNRTSRKKVMLSPPYIAKVCTLPNAKLRRLNRPSGSIGDRVCCSCTTNVLSRTSPPSAGAHTSGLLQPSTGWRISASTGPARPNNVSRASQSARVRRPVAGRGRRPDEHQRRNDERDVDGEDQPPGDGVDEKPARQWTDHGGDPRPRRPRADRAAALLARERRHDHGQRARRQQRAKRPPQRTTGDQELDARPDRATAATRRRSPRRRSRTRAVRRTGRRATRRPELVTRAPAGRRWTPTVGPRARPRGPRGSPAARR